MHKNTLENILDNVDVPFSSKPMCQNKRDDNLCFLCNLVFCHQTNLLIQTDFNDKVWHSGVEFIWFNNIWEIANKYLW